MSTKMFDLYQPKYEPILMPETSMSVFTFFNKIQ